MGLEKPDETLLDYLDRLTLPHKEMVIQSRRYRTSGGMHEVACVSHTDRDGLIVQLREALVGGVGRHGASGFGADRIPLNEGALTLYRTIERQIIRDYLDMGLPAADVGTVPPERLLRRWYVAHAKLVLDQKATDETALRQARMWVAQIEAMFNPPSRLELTVERRWVDEVPTVVRTATGRERTVIRKVERSKREPAPCPKCGERYGYDPTNGDRMLALLLEYYELGPQTFGNLRAECRFCGWEWHGEAAARDLMVAIDEKDRELQADEEVERLRPLLIGDTPDARSYAPLVTSR